VCQLQDISDKLHQNRRSQINSAFYPLQTANNHQRRGWAVTNGEGECSTTAASLSGSTTQVKRLGPKVGSRPVLHSSDELGELSQWLCHDDSTINTVLHYYYYYHYHYYYYHYITLTAASEPSALKSSYFITSAMMKPFSKSVWILPAACGAFVPRCIHDDSKNNNKSENLRQKYPYHVLQQTQQAPK